MNETEESKTKKKEENLVSGGFWWFPVFSSIPELTNAS